MALLMDQLLFKYKFDFADCKCGESFLFRPEIRPNAGENQKPNVGGSRGQFAEPRWNRTNSKALQVS